MERFGRRRSETKSVRCGRRCRQPTPGASSSPPPYMPKRTWARSTPRPRPPIQAKPITRELRPPRILTLVRLSHTFRPHDPHITPHYSLDELPAQRPAFTPGVEKCLIDRKAESSLQPEKIAPIPPVGCKALFGG